MQTSTTQHPAPTRRPTLTFWSALLVLNWLLFVPLYLLNLENTYFLPWIDTVGNFPDEPEKWLLRFRSNFDIFRICLEIVAIAGLAALIPHQWGESWWQRISRTVIHIVSGAVYLLIIYYYIYEALTLSFFLADPIIYNQYFMAVDGLQFLLQNVNLSWITYALAFLGIVLLHMLIIFLLRTLFRAAPRINWGSRSLLLVILICAGLVTMRYQQTTANPLMVVSSAAYKIKKNISDSFEVQASTAAYDEQIVLDTYDYTRGSFADVQLTKWPNIYLILVESYGSVLYKRDDFRQQYTTLLDELETSLSQNNWHIASGLSEAPTWGGGSWMSYGSLLFGMRIETHPQFLFLRNQYRFKEYPDLGYFLKSHGYRYYRLSPLSIEMPDHEWAQYQNFYGVDEWLRHRDLNYSGTQFSWGPSPPDQYSLNFMRQHMRNQSATTNQPHFFFMITQNSHYPWSPMPPVVDEWAALNEPMQTTVLPGPRDHQWTRRNYFNAIEYQLRALTDFVLKSGDEDAIFILVGDHQPPRVARKSDGWETPMHIISRDAGLADALTNYGFINGLEVPCQPDLCEATLRHEGFYSLFVRTYLEQYRTAEGIALPRYLPDGVQFADP